MNEQQKTGILTLMGFAQKAGKAAAGEGAVEAYLKKGKAKLLLIASDWPIEKQEQWLAIGENNGIAAKIFAPKAEMGYAIGMPAKGVVAICDEQMAQAIMKKFV